MINNESTSTPFYDHQTSNGISFIIPAYNEQDGIECSLKMLLQTLQTIDTPWEIIVVNDGSRDSTPAIVSKFSDVTLINHPINIGYGNALKTGIKRSKYDWICICDADCSYPSTQIPLLISEMRNGFDMVTGYRQNIFEHDQFFKKIMRKIFIKSISVLTGNYIPDPNSGLRIFKKTLVMEFFNFLCGGFSFTTSLTVLAAEKPSFIKFIPIQYSNRKGHSKVQHFRDTIRTIQLIVQGVTYYNPIKFFTLLTLFLIILIACPAMILAMFRMHTLSSYYMLFGCVVAILLGIGVLGDIVRISATKFKDKQ